MSQELLTGMYTLLTDACRDCQRMFPWGSTSRCWALRLLLLPRTTSPLLSFQIFTPVSWFSRQWPAPLPPASSRFKKTHWTFQFFQHFLFLEWKWCHSRTWQDRVETTLCLLHFNPSISGSMQLTLYLSWTLNGSIWKLLQSIWRLFLQWGIGSRNQDIWVLVCSLFCLSLLPGLCSLCTLLLYPYLTFYLYPCKYTHTHLSISHQFTLTPPTLI